MDVRSWTCLKVKSINYKLLYENKKDHLEDNAMTIPGLRKRLLFDGMVDSFAHSSHIHSTPLFLSCSLSTYDKGGSETCSRNEGYRLFLLFGRHRLGVVHKCFRSANNGIRKA
jgi:hypothetical protein